MRLLNLIPPFAISAVALMACGAEAIASPTSIPVAPEPTISSRSPLPSVEPIVEPTQVTVVLETSSPVIVRANSTATPLLPIPTIEPPTHRLGVPETTASAITFAPFSLIGLNSQTHVYGTGADPDVITLGPREGGRPDWQPYPGKTSMEFELPRGTPILAPISMEFVGFNNRNAAFRIGPDGERFEPFDDLELCFESTDPDWPGLVICTYHLMTSPLLIGHDVDPDCGKTEEWPGKVPQAQGHLWSDNSDGIAPATAFSQSCQALLGKTVERGQLIGFAGNVGDHSMAPFRFKVPDESINELVRMGNRNLHWVQPGSFFYWKCFEPEADFSSGILAYPFECEGFEVPLEQRDTTFKYQVSD